MRIYFNSFLAVVYYVLSWEDVVNHCKKNFNLRICKLYPYFASALH